MTPLATVTPRLEQEFRFDVFSETLPTHAHLDNYGAGKGLEIIPTENTEIIIGAPPPYETRRSNVGNTLADGWADWPALLVKYRFLSADEQQGPTSSRASFNSVHPQEIRRSRTISTSSNQPSLSEKVGMISMCRPR